MNPTILEYSFCVSKFRCYIYKFRGRMSWLTQLHSQSTHAPGWQRTYTLEYLTPVQWIHPTPKVVKVVSMCQVWTIMHSHKADTQVATDILMEEPLSLSLSHVWNSDSYDTCKSAPTSCGIWTHAISVRYLAKPIILVAISSSFSELMWIFNNLSPSVMLITESRLVNRFWARSPSLWSLWKTCHCDPPFLDQHLITHHSSVGVCLNE